ncbi:hypothetical protein FSARC_12828 [Fusarium sarcochroum]|uniref:Acetoacetate decarboxylase n=1 Tax=Fusarium sarcochroum TaxID=1208366 RepID=A0A8H4T5G3_9HYPO|nr:hypothetical protein FSARC_12828 [Fusarium sarcochroum]
MPQGSLTLTGTAVPAVSPSYPTTETFSFTDVTLAAISYRVAADQITHLIPDALELEDEPLVTSTFVEYGMSTVGPYSEFVQTVEVTYNGEKYDYTLILILDNESAIFAGRELYGYPKVFGKTILQLGNNGRLISGSAERPIGRRIAAFEFIPEKLVRELPLSKKRTLNLRTIPSPIPGAAPTVNEFMSVAMDVASPEVWIGKGSMDFLQGSALDAWADIDIIKYEGAILARHATATLRV